VTRSVGLTTHHSALSIQRFSSVWTEYLTSSTPPDAHARSAGFSEQRNQPHHRVTFVRGGMSDFDEQRLVGDSGEIIVRNHASL
jgi:hypothetical protein